MKAVEVIPASKLHEYVEAAKFQATEVLGPLCHAGHSGVLSSSPKVGKTTYLSWMVATQAVRPVLYLSEMTSHQWDLLVEPYWTDEQKEGVDFIFKDQVFGSPWIDIVGMLTAKVVNGDNTSNYQLCIIETARKFWQLRAGEWSDAGPVQLCIDSYDGMLAVGCGVLTSHHERKSGGSHGEGMSGTNAFAGAVDSITTMTRVGAGVNSRKRKLTFESRFPAPDEQVVEWQDDGFTFKVSDHATAILAILAAAGSDLTEKQITEKWGEDAPSHASLFCAFKSMVDHGTITKRRDGGGGTPWRYRLSAYQAPPVTVSKRTVGGLSSKTDSPQQTKKTVSTPQKASNSRLLSAMAFLRQELAGGKTAARFLLVEDAKDIEGISRDDLFAAGTAIGVTVTKKDKAIHWSLNGQANTAYHSPRRATPAAPDTRRQAHRRSHR